MINFNNVTIIVILAVYIGISLVFLKLKTKAIIQGVRFVLDNLPSLQMTIDAELNAGIIAEEESLKRRELLKKDVSINSNNDAVVKILMISFVIQIFIMVSTLIINIIFVDITNIVGWTFLIFTILQSLSIFVILYLIKRSPYIKSEEKPIYSEDEIKEKILNIQENISKEK